MLLLHLYEWIFEFYLTCGKCIIDLVLFGLVLIAFFTYRILSYIIFSLISILILKLHLIIFITSDRVLHSCSYELVNHFIRMV
jgi:hypothetical protein